MQNIRPAARPIRRHAARFLGVALRLLLRVAMTAVIVWAAALLLPACDRLADALRGCIDFADGSVVLRLFDRQLLFDRDILALCGDRLSRLLDISARLVPSILRETAADIFACVADAFRGIG